MEFWEKKGVRNHVGSLLVVSRRRTRPAARSCLPVCERVESRRISGVMQPRIQYCTSADGTRIAYAVMGEGPLLLTTPSSWESASFVLQDAIGGPFYDHPTAIALTLPLTPKCRTSRPWLIPWASNLLP